MQPRAVDLVLHLLQCPAHRLRDLAVAEAVIDAEQEGRAAFLSFDRRELAMMLAPPTAMPQEIERLRNDLTTVVQAISQRATQETAPVGMMEQIA